MKKSYVCCLLFLCLYTLNGQHISIGKIDSINSKILNEQRELWIHVPDDYSKNEKYPVVYLLDGHSNFHAVVGMIKQMSSGSKICPKMIVVGIPNTNRTRDLTPTKTKPNFPSWNVARAAISGGGGNFISFIEKELIPYIDSNYSTESYRMFIGHSLGGLTVMNTLVYKPELFNSYVAIDPSMFWDNERLLNEIKNLKLDKRYQNKSLFLGIANTMDKGMDTIKVKNDTTKTTKHIRAILTLNSLLAKDTLNNLSFKSNYYQEEDHGSVPIIAEYDALKYIFDFYKLKLRTEFLKDPENVILDIVQNYYKRLSKEFGREIIPSQYFIDDLAQRLMEVQQLAKAERLYKLNVTNYPKNAYVYTVLADCYLALGNKEKAIENFKKANSLSKSSYLTEQLYQLQDN
ncbi:alpha/beta hydrolase-fold protein [Cellulophaga sp. Asnod2-G02]|uniref:alpha/beta hydrolase-fold protein n=1 Tax=Cellulophaga sp. Asnod2-G02 TaxID=3160572 RepID=UPI0038632BC3